MRSYLLGYVQGRMSTGEEDYALYAVLGSRQYVAIFVGLARVDFDPNFRLDNVRRMSDPAYRAQVLAWARRRITNGNYSRDRSPKPRRVMAKK